MLKYIILLSFVTVSCVKTDLSKKGTTVSNVNTFKCPPPIATGNSCSVNVSHKVGDARINLKLTSEDIAVVGLSITF